MITYNRQEYREWVESMIKDPKNWRMFKDKANEMREKQKETRAFIDMRCKQLVRALADEKWFFEWSIDKAKNVWLKWEQKEERRFELYAAISRGKQIPKGIQPEEVKHVPVGEFFSTPGRGTRSRKLFLCPFHNETTPSFTWYVDQNTWWCYACNIGGDVIDLVMKLFNLEFRAALAELKKY